MMSIGKTALCCAAGGTVLAVFLLASGSAHDVKWIAPASAEAVKNPVAADKASIDAGKKVYKKECYSCHGKSGEGNGPQADDLETPPGNLQLSEVQEQSDGALFWKISEGKKPMPTLKAKLSETDRWNVINYLRTFKKAVLPVKKSE
jgi:mono/diheme cytochrome c family protein